VANALLDALEGHARREGLRWLYLDSHDRLKAAVALYRKREFVPCKRYNDNPQAAVFLRKRIGLGQSPARRPKRRDAERPVLP
jgi:ribosomal protein S18 acetylase RimI-like enzyme